VKPSELVGLLFLARDVAHSTHLNTRSYAKHVALQEFYESIVDLADKFAEAYQGYHGLIGPISVPAAKKTSNIVEFLQGQVEDIEGGRYKVCDRDNTPIQNIIDEIVGRYYASLYKLRFLA
jgi:hypothetical protein